MNLNRAVTGAPTGLPQLQPGKHLEPAEGGCFMEYASLLAGEGWSDHPRCTHPALAQLARLVNDAAPPAVRQRLTLLVPDVIGLNRTSAALTPQLVTLCIDSMHRPGRPQWAWSVQRRWAARRVAAAARSGWSARWCALTDPAYRGGPAQRLMTQAVQQAAKDTPATGERLIGLLAEAIAATALDRGPTSTAAASAPSKTSVDQSHRSTPPPQGESACNLPLM